MVSVRKSHQMSQASFEQWLAALELDNDKKAALEKLYQKVNYLFDDSTPCQTKSLEMVEILSGLNLDTDSLCAAFICPLYEYKCISLEYIKENFSKQIYLLCKGFSQMEAIKALQQSQSSLVNTNQIDNIRRMLLAMVEDVRAVVIKLAERLCHLRLVKDSDEETRVLAAKETSNIYAPLANRLGIGQLKWELEDLSFRYLHPEVYKEIAKQLDEKRLDRERYMAEFVDNISKQLKSSDIKGVVCGRPKHIYSIWKKMQQKSLDFEQLFDVRAVRVIVDELQGCYGALGLVHTSWKHLSKEFDDYVATPKSNGYQSIHTVVIGPEDKTIEIQIRTQQMHDDAELGVAAHWRYKEGNASGKTSGFDEKVSWLRKILQWQEDVSESGELLDELRSQVFEDRIYVFTPGGDVVDLPSGATPLDFAYYIHSNVGHSCIGAKVFGRIVPFTYLLQTGDQVEVLRSKTLNPSRDWLNPSLNYLHTPRARAKVQHFFRLLDRDKNLAAGKEMLDTALGKLQLSLAKVDFSAAIERFNFTTKDDLFAAVGSGSTRLLQVVHCLQQQDEKLKPEVDIDPQSLIRQPQQADTEAADNNGITVSGVGNLLTHMAKCCHPVPGDEIAGFITQGRGISVHRVDCEQLANALNQQPEREVEVQWGINNKKSYQVSINIIGGDRQGLLRDISTIISNERVSIIGIESHTDNAKQSMSMTIKVEIANNEALTRLLAKLKQLDDVAEVKRL
ncbi:GTP diphosphokinase [Colwellia sp. MB02u-18]|uniref:GTP diphosphokinase n=1 Tax=unclassified Colwellia TaxID=196834 RepID=UPI0015F73D17|nr:MULTISPECIES: GTP diphosphokinase [unclassified Colwellia]MBA6223104.1 GTP diphosphokinase [Colwellia sp. MB3u-45]MBA6267528.1 GTP diphosphokinase [Colwellia sp. MB3u-43]MBA6320345.1 GTP diphosphokinase [Colwellia sp. MB02u-19]MBA6323104.1 GTP diphosphokinase [Colwellia sp. MB02u-18]MBA6330437.1 GTP diphosphokinase [Colwellia sp. MB02u-12]